jgi:hypothetical protein
VILGLSGSTLIFLNKSLSLNFMYEVELDIYCSFFY